MSLSAVAKYIRLTLEIKKVNLMAQMEYRLSFFLEVIFSIGIHAAFLYLWVLFFTKVPAVEGWTIRDSATLIGIAWLGDAFVGLLAGGIHGLAKMIANGQLDVYLLMPHNLIWQVAVTKTYNYAFGSAIVCMVNFYLFGDFTPARFALFIFMAIISALIMFNFILIAQSIGFYVGNFETAADKMQSALYTLQFYPTNIYHGVLRFLMIWIFPVYFTAALPTQLVNEWSTAKFGILLLFWAATGILGITIFNRGLSKYESGSLIQSRV